MPQILHLSDLHFGPHCIFPEPKIEERARGFGRQIRGALAGINWLERPNLVIVTGDLTENASLPQFHLANKFLSVLSDELEVARQYFIFVPGNHDVSWPRCRQVLESQKIFDWDEEETRKKLDLRKFDLYDRFRDCFYRSEEISSVDIESMPDSTSRRPGFTGSAARDLSGGGVFYGFPEFRISVGALNSCEKESHREEDHVGLVGERQIANLLEEWEKSQYASWIRLVALHHNPSGTVPANVEQEREFLKRLAAEGKLEPSHVDRAISDLVMFEGVENLRRLASLGRVHLILHGHHHAKQEKVWNWKTRGHTYILSAGSLALPSESLPGGEPPSARLIRLRAEKNGVEIQSCSVSYNSRLRLSDSLETGGYELDRSDEPIFEQVWENPKRVGAWNAGFVERHLLKGKELDRAGVSDSQVVQWAFILVEMLKSSCFLEIIDFARSIREGSSRVRVKLIDEANRVSREISWMAWFRLKSVLEELGEVESLLSSPDSVSGVVVDFLMGRGRKIEPEQLVAVGRIFCGADPLWPEESDIGLLNLWPSRRRLVGVNIQAAVACGSAMNLQRLARSIASAVRSIDYSAAESLALNLAESSSQRNFEGDLIRFWEPVISRVRGVFNPYVPLPYLAERLDLTSRGQIEDLRNWAQFVALRLEPWSNHWANRLALGWIDSKEERRLRVEPATWLVDASGLELLSPGRNAARVALLQESMRFTGSSAFELLKLAVQSSLRAGFGRSSYLSRLRQLEGEISPVWTLLSKHLAGLSTYEDRQELVRFARNPRACGDESLELGMRFIVRGDVMDSDYKIHTLAELGIHEESLPYLEDLPEEIGSFDLSGRI